MEDYKIIDDGTICWHVDTMRFTPALQERANRELNERPEDKALRTLREMVTSQTDLTSRTDDAFLVRFLRARKFNCEHAYNLLRNYYKHRADHPLVYGNFRPSAVKDLLEKSDLTVLPYRDPKGRPVLHLAPGSASRLDVPFHLCLRVCLFCLETLIESEATQVNGFVLLMDCRCAGFELLKNLATPSNLRCALSIIQDSFPARFKAMHVVFENVVIDAVYTIAKPFLKKKLKERIMFHGDDLQSLHQYLPPAILPVEYGGTLHLDKSVWTRKLLMNEDNLLNNNQFGFKV